MIKRKILKKKYLREEVDVKWLWHKHKTEYDVNKTEQIVGGGMP